MPPSTSLDRLDEFGRMVREARLARGWSQEKLAQRLKIAQTYLSALELGEGGHQIDVRASLLVKFSRALQLDLDKLTLAAALRGDHEPPSTRSYGTSDGGIAPNDDRQPTDVGDDGAPALGAE